MGLEEKKLKHRLETEVIPNMAAEIGGCYGGEVTIEIDWDTFAQVSTLNEIENQVLGRTAEAIRTLSKDDFAKEALLESFKSIYVKYIENSDDRSCEFSDGRLSLQANWDDHFAIFTDADIRNKVEEGL